MISSDWANDLAAKIRVLADDGANGVSLSQYEADESTLENDPNLELLQKYDPSMFIQLIGSGSDSDVDNLKNDLAWGKSGGSDVQALYDDAAEIETL